VAPPMLRGRALAAQRLWGLVFLAVLLGLVGLSIAMYNKTFTAWTEVTLQADRVGNQITQGADVKARGVIVGEVRSIRATADGTELDLRLRPDAAERIPADTSAMILPKTLFGEKFVALTYEGTDTGGRPALADGAVIAQDRTETARETSEALDSLLPLLQTLNPEAVSTTLNAVSSALRDRGDRIGSNLVLARDYFVEFNPELPTLQRNLQGTADFADTLTAATPDILSLLDDLSAVNRNLVRDQAALDRFLRDTTGVAGTIEDFVAENEERFVRLAAEGRGPLELFATYSPSFPCLADGLAQSEAFIGDSFGGMQPGLHITLEFIANQGGYEPNADEPQYLETRGPDCFGLPNPGVPAEDFNFRDGFRDDQPRETTRPPADDGSSPFASASFSDADADRRVINAVVAPFLGVEADRVPDVAHLLFGPVARGTVVGLSGGSSSGSAS
jgi:phospholipid/cholesterol/gamma-HCH transport system substrate-binding protein